jgi:uncharacterized protein with HEPN domain
LKNPKTRNVQERSVSVVEEITERMLHYLPWRSMRNMRNRMAHGYFDINLDVVWETVQEWLLALLQQLPAVRQVAGDEDGDSPEQGKPC